MKISTLFAISVWLVGSVTFASPAPSSTSKTSVNPRPLVHQFNLRLRNQWVLIQQGLKSGKLTKDQAISLRGNLKSARQQEVGFFKLNKNHDLSTDQQGQLNALLDKNSSVLNEPVGH